MQEISKNICFDGVQGVYSHSSTSCDCEMIFGLYLPPQAKFSKVPAIWFLSGLTCTHENAMTKAGVQGWAAKHGVAIIFPDTSPRGQNIPDDKAYDLGQGAGFYVDAVATPWSKNYNMWTYITSELQELVVKEFPIDTDRQAIMGHSMGGHGALTMAIHLPDLYKSVSAFSPICNPTKSEWGIKQFSSYLGSNESKWESYDSSILMLNRGYKNKVLIDQGADDNFHELLKLDSMKAAMESRGQSFDVRIQPGYDHSYFFIQSFIEDHIKHHVDIL